MKMHEPLTNELAEIAEKYAPPVLVTATRPKEWTGSDIADQRGFGEQNKKEQITL